MNIYRLTNTVSHEVITGTTRELEAGHDFDSNKLRDCIHSGYLLGGIWKVEKIGVCGNGTKVKERTKTKGLTIDEIAVAAYRCNMTYGQYVAKMEVLNGSRV